MNPIDGRARESTGARPAYDPAAERTPGARGAAPGVSLGGPSLAVPPVAGEGGYSPSPLSRERAAATEPDPETGGSGSEPAPPVRGRAPRAPGRTFTIALPAGLKLLSLNDRGHWAARYRRSEALKKAAWAMALQAKIPRLERVSITAEYQPPDRRHRDADNPVASVKAAIDGIVAAGILPSDESPRYVASVTCSIGQPYPKGRLVLHLAELPALRGSHPAGRLLAPKPPGGDVA